MPLKLFYVPMQNFLTSLLSPFLPLILSDLEKMYLYMHPWGRSRSSSTVLQPELRLQETNVKAVLTLSVQFGIAYVWFFFFFRILSSIALSIFKHSPPCPHLKLGHQQTEINWLLKLDTQTQAADRSAIKSLTSPNVTNSDLRQG